MSCNLNSLCCVFYKIKVSVSSGGDCIRTYRPEIKKGSYNTVIVNVKTAVADNLLFYLGSAKFVSLVLSFLLLEFLNQTGSLANKDDKNVFH